MGKVKRLQSLIIYTFLPNILSFILGMVFLAAGIGKLLQGDEYLAPAGFQFLPAQFSGIINLILPWMEIALGILIISGYLRKIVIPVSLGLIFVFIGINTLSLINGVQTQCNCFGGMINLTHGQSLVIDLIMLAAAGTLLMLNLKLKTPGRKSPMPGKVRIATAIAAGIMMVVLAATGTGAVASSNTTNHPLMHPTEAQLTEWEKEYLNTPVLERMETFSFMESESPVFSLMDHFSYVPVERNQGQAGNCWVWAGTGLMEIELDVEVSIFDRLSVQYFDSYFENGAAGIWAGCGGTANEFALTYNNLILHGVIPWANTNAYYQDWGQTCGEGSAVEADDISISPYYPITSDISAYNVFPTSPDISQADAIAAIKATLQQHKPIYFGFYLNSTGWSAFNIFWDDSPESSVWDPGSYATGTSAGGHGVVCVGYDDTDASWIMVNSWGTADSRPNGIFKVTQLLNYNSMISGIRSFKWQVLDNIYTVHNITASAGSGGAITPAGEIPVLHSTNAAFSITPEPGYVIEDVLVDGGSVGAVDSYTFINVTANHTIAASFVPGVYIVTAAVSGGHGTVEPDTQDIDYGDDATVEITPDSGFIIGTITDNGNPAVIADPYVISPVTQNHDVVVTFRPEPFDGKLVYSDITEIYTLIGYSGQNNRLTENSFEDGTAAWSPDGSKIAFSSNRSGVGGLYIMNADGSNVVYPGYEGGWPGWSPDGTRIAFSYWDGDDFEIYVIDADGTNPVRLTDNAVNDHSAAWSPDGGHIAFIFLSGGDTLLNVMDANGLNLTQLTAFSVGSPSWSPDGSKIVFSRYDTANPEIWTIQPDGNNLTSLNCEGEYPDYAPDGTQIVFSRGGILYIMDADGSNQGSMGISGVDADWAADPIVNFPDANLNTAIREAISKPTGDIYQSDLLSLISLTASGRTISNLSGLEYCTNLISLWLQNNQITNVSPLSSLTNLNILDLSFNQISNISPLAELSNLTQLGLAVNQISDISVLSGLNNITYLGLSNNQISDISSLAGLTGLTNLYLAHNQIMSISPLNELVNLTHLQLQGNVIRDTSSIAGLNNLTYLDLMINQISDISPLGTLTSLTNLDLAQNQITNISPLSGLTNLTSISLYKNQITDISPLSGLVNLTSLDLDNNQIKDISALSGLSNLDLLIISHNQISSISPLVDNIGLSGGESVNVSYNCLDLSDGSQDMLDIQVLIDRGVSVTYIPQITYGMLRVQTVPAVPTRIYIDGIPRDDWGLNWVKMEPGNYMLSFSDVYGFNTPTSVTVNYYPGTTGNVQPLSEPINIDANVVTEVIVNFEQLGNLWVEISPPMPATVFCNGHPMDDWGFWCNIEPGDYTISFQDIDGYITPEPQVVTVTAGYETTHIVGTYVAGENNVEASTVGLLRVQTNPAVPTRIFLDGLPRNDWGLNWVKMTPGDYVLSFSDVYGYGTPTSVAVNYYPGTTGNVQSLSEPIHISADVVTEVIVNFVPLGNLRVETSPAVPATIYCNGNPMDDWGFWCNIEPGEYTISFEEREGYTTPPPIVVTVVAGAGTHVVGNYSTGTSEIVP